MYALESENKNAKAFNSVQVLSCNGTLYSSSQNGARTARGVSFDALPSSDLNAQRNPRTGVVTQSWAKTQWGWEQQRPREGLETKELDAS